LPLLYVDCLEILEASSAWSPKGLHRLVQAYIAFPSRLHFSLPPYFLCFQSGEAAAKARREWEEAMAAVLRDIAATPKQQPRPVVQIVIYESSV